MLAGKKQGIQQLAHNRKAFAMNGQQIFEQWREGMITTREGIDLMEDVVNESQEAVNASRVAIAMLKADRLSFYAN